METWQAINLVSPCCPPLQAKYRRILYDTEMYSGARSNYRQTKEEPNLDYGHLHGRNFVPKMALNEVLV